MQKSASIPVTKVTLSAAFSLIELLMVLVIASALLAIAIPTLSHSDSNTLRASREVVKAQLRQARSHAISKRTPTALIISAQDSGAHYISRMEVKLEDGTYLPVVDDSGTPQLIERFSALPGNARLIEASAIDSEKRTLLGQEQTLQIHYQGSTHVCHFMVFGANGQILSPPPGTPIHIAIATLRGPEKIAAFDFIHVNRLTGATRSVQP